MECRVNDGPHWKTNGRFGSFQERNVHHKKIYPISVNHRFKLKILIL